MVKKFKYKHIRIFLLDFFLDDLLVMNIMGTEHETIFISIASYRDSECQHTVNDIFEKAEHPNNIIIGICFQFHPEQDSLYFEGLKDHPRKNQIKIDYVHMNEACGPCWARYKCQQLYQNETYFFSN